MSKESISRQPRLLIWIAVAVPGAMFGFIVLLVVLLASMQSVPA